MLVSQMGSVGKPKPRGPAMPLAPHARLVRLLRCRRLPDLSQSTHGAIPFAVPRRCRRPPRTSQMSDGLGADRERLADCVRALRRTVRACKERERVAGWTLTATIWRMLESM